MLPEVSNYIVILVITLFPTKKASVFPGPFLLWLIREGKVLKLTGHKKITQNILVCWSVLEIIPKNGYEILKSSVK